MISKESFTGLDRLETLVVTELYRLERFDAGSLNTLRVLKTLSLPSWPRFDKHKFRLSHVLNGLPTLRKLSVTFVEETLSDQLRDIYTPKLRHVEITGKHLRNVEQDALVGLGECRQLLIQIHNTHIEELPIGLFAVLSTVVHLSIDLQNNKLASLSPSTFYSNATAWESVGTKLIAGTQVIYTLVYIYNEGLFSH